MSSVSDDNDGVATHIHQNVALAIAGSSMFANRESDYDVIQGVSTMESYFMLFMKNTDVFNYAVL